MKNQTIINYNTLKLTNKRYNSWGHLIYCKKIPDEPGKKIEQYRKMLIKQKIAFVERRAPDGRNAIIFEF